MAVPAPGTATRPIHPWPGLGAPHPAMSRAAGTVLCEDADAYAETALREATEAGFTPREVAELLAGRPVTALVPPHPDEPLGAYADRATSELFIRTIAAGPDADAGWI
ncbi:hypothetical protein ASG52_25470 [Methylobacterium sp. Leaf456]|uniref:hypothetical protein n=1 Tax=Methylobacterium sp. Leaf456 TaxID=1736382 RepID=UPI0006F98BF5|nr:hypothetical protein [Methylobacterium sp. Leaf456]KQT52746.1 hypothetical protein ASG52_25470 [Methylobacterium sp. Leaf456]